MPSADKEEKNRTAVYSGIKEGGEGGAAIRRCSRNVSLINNTFRPPSQSENYCRTVLEGGGGGGHQKTKLN